MDESVEYLTKAMLEAHRAFEEYFDERDLDSAYFELQLTGYINDMEFNRWKKVDMDFDYRDDKEDID